MKTKELKQFMTSEEYKQESEYIKFVSMLKLMIQGLWIPFLYFIAIGYLIIFGLYICLGMGYDYEILKTCGSYIFGIIAFTWLNKKKFNIENLRGENCNKENDFIIFQDVDEEWTNTIEEYYKLKQIDNPSQNEQIKIKELYNKLSEKLDSCWR